MQLDPPAPGADTSRRLRRLLVWSVLTVLAAIALALAMVLASLALAPHPDSAPPPTPPMQFPAGGGPRPE
jgi:hypothetical protein